MRNVAFFESTLLIRTMLDPGKTTSYAPAGILVCPASNSNGMSILIIRSACAGTTNSGKQSAAATAILQYISHLQFSVFSTSRHFVVRVVGTYRLHSRSQPSRRRSDFRNRRVPLRIGAHFQE